MIAVEAVNTPVKGSNTTATAMGNDGIRRDIFELFSMGSGKPGFKAVSAENKATMVIPSNNRIELKAQKRGFEYLLYM